MNFKKFIFFLLLFLIANSTIAIAKEITIFDSLGEATAYVDTEDDKTIYLWAGEPVAYLDNDSIYGFNGKHLGWIDAGILYDHDGNAVGFLEGSVNKPTALEPLKGLKNLTSLKSLEELEPLKPIFSEAWEPGLKYFLSNGES